MNAILTGKAAALGVEYGRPATLFMSQNWANWCFSQQSRQRVPSPVRVEQEVVMSHKWSNPTPGRLFLALTGTLMFSAVGSIAAASGISAAALSRYLPGQASTIARVAPGVSNRVVSKCADDGSPGTLRTVIASALPGDTIDMSGLPAADPACVAGTITLTTGALSISSNLTLKGPAHAVLALVGSGTDRVIASSAASLHIDDLTIRHGRGPSKAGCIASSAEIVLDHTAVTDCIVTGSSKYAQGAAIGGGIYANSVVLTNASSITDSHANGAKSPNFNKYPGAGGGVFAKIAFSCTDSTISANSASLFGGGIVAYGSPSLLRCTVDSNERFGMYLPSTSGVATITSSTISGNSGGGIWSKPALEMTNSTVAFNFSDGDTAGGIYAISNLTMQSSIVASNISASAYHADLRMGGGVYLTGADNLIVSTDATPDPGVITVTEDPQLLPLASNGGPTQTHALPAHSAAIDMGNNGGGLLTDQRGAGFVREMPAGSPDIGAYEFRGDGIFIDGFEDDE